MFNIFKKPIPEYVLSVARETRKETEDIGHNKVFFMDGFKKTGIVPLFNDILI